MNRRKFIRNSSFLTAFSGLFPATKIVVTEINENKKQSLKVAFISDVHVKPTQVAEAGMRKAFRKANELKPDFIINGGDAIMDALKADKQKVQLQWDVWNKVLQDENKLTIYHTIGNHDAWGWQMDDPAIKSDPLYDKGWVLQQHKMPGRYYSFTQKNWKFVILDSPHENNGGYIARIDDPQYVWLENELKQTSSETNICIISHIPIASFCSAMFVDENQANGDWRVSRALLHVDARKLIELFTHYKNIRCCLSGHIHLQDAVEYKGIKYFCNGAVSGDWWSGPFKGFDPAFAMFTFGSDGTVQREIINYGTSV